MWKPTEALKEHETLRTVTELGIEQMAPELCGSKSARCATVPLYAAIIMQNYDMQNNIKI